MDIFEKIGADAKRGREEAQELVARVNAGHEKLSLDMTRERALEILNGCIADYTTILKRLGRHGRA
jgi:hypothetical protein